MIHQHGLGLVDHLLPAEPAEQVPGGQQTLDGRQGRRTGPGPSDEVGVQTRHGGGGHALAQKHVHGLERIDRAGDRIQGPQQFPGLQVHQIHVELQTAGRCRIAPGEDVASPCPASDLLCGQWRGRIAVSRQISDRSRRHDRHLARPVDASRDVLCRHERPVRGRRIAGAVLERYHDESVYFLGAGLPDRSRSCSSQQQEPHPDDGRCPRESGHPAPRPALAEAVLAGVLLQGVRELLRGREPIRRSLGQRLRQRRFDAGRHRLPHHRDPGRGLAPLLRQDRLRRRPGVGRLTAQHLVQHAAQGVDVGPAVHLIRPARLLGAHVGRRAHRQARLRDPRAPGLLDRPGDPEVGHHGVAPFEQDVLGLDVAVDDPPSVRIVQRVGHLAGDPHRVLDRELLLPVQPIAQALALDVGHDAEQEAVGLAGVVQRTGCAGGSDQRRSRSRAGSARSRRPELTSGLRTLIATLR